jgi:hypothetical protein
MPVRRSSAGLAKTEVAYGTIPDGKTTAKPSYVPIRAERQEPLRNHVLRTFHSHRTTMRSPQFARRCTRNDAMHTIITHVTNGIALDTDIVCAATNHT